MIFCTSCVLVSTGTCPNSIRHHSLTRLCLEGFLLSFLKVSGCLPPAEVPPCTGSRFPRPQEPKAKDPKLKIPGVDILKKNKNHTRGVGQNLTKRVSSETVLGITLLSCGSLFCTKCYVILSSQCVSVGMLGSPGSLTRWRDRCQHLENIKATISIQIIMYDARSV